ncbi:hypothetical protein DRP53_08685 [candidate division WOR-3 bacterium]|uniref:protein-glutamate O-methyltransferase n=1 Tax=candidate division WOR-3 bacterium TaxID=2052148 RepID=A0A660SFG5_UNCW3|nr:MAG: hypothetical protein DRP53_08685 [candidate division WOR-3 bacterium]
MLDFKPLKTDFTQEEFEKFRNLIEERSGVYIEDRNLDSLRISIVTEMSINGIDSFEEYYNLLKDRDPYQEYLRNLINLVLVNEASFYQTPVHFDILKNTILPEIIQRKEDNKLSIWSAGCSTGEEPYSIAITIAEAADLLKDYEIRIIASDVSQNALDIAKEGLYSAEKVKALPASIIEKYFTREGSDFRLDPEIIKMVEFRIVNLVRDDFPFDEFKGLDIIFSRNVTVHFKLESTRKVLDRYFHLLNDPGYLFVDPSEDITSIYQGFQPIQFQGVKIYMKGTSAFIGAIPAKLSLASVYLRQKKYDLAIKVCDDILSTNPGNVDALIFEGMIKFKMGDLSGAEANLKKSLQVNDRILVANLFLAEVYRELGKREEAMRYYDRTLQLLDEEHVETNVERIIRLRGETISRLALDGKKKLATQTG